MHCSHIRQQSFYPAILLVLLLFFVSTVYADSLRCGGHLVGPGDRMFEVRKICGEPDIKVVLQSAFTANYGFLPYHEEWQYNFGPQQLMQFLRFRNGRLSSIETGPHGFVRPREQCNPFTITAGLSTLELLARCGEPTLVERRIAEHSYRMGITGPFFPAGSAMEDWIYDSSKGHFHRIVSVIDGRVVNIDSGKYRD